MNITKTQKEILVLLYETKDEKEILDDIKILKKIGLLPANNVEEENNPIKIIQELVVLGLIEDGSLGTTCITTKGIEYVKNHLK